MINLETKLNSIVLKNPIMPASGTFGFGEDFKDLYDLNILGAIVTKGTTYEPKFGNKTPRVAETFGGMLNAIGLQNDGVKIAIQKKIPLLREYNTPIIVNIGGHSIDDYLNAVKEINTHCDIIELNVSCPNVKSGGIGFGSNKDLLFEVVRKVKEVTTTPVFVKLSPNVTNIVEMAIIAQEAGADGLTLINTLVGMRLDLKTGKPILANKTGGLSGPAIKPVAIKMVYEVYKNVNIPIIGVGGISNANDVLEFIYAGASAVQIGTMNLVDPYICQTIINELPMVLNKYGFDKLEDAIGFAHKGE